MKLQLLFDYVGIEEDSNDSTNSAGIATTGNLDSVLRRGTVVSAGSGKYDNSGTFRPLVYKVGDKVLFKNQRFEHYTEDGKQYRIGLEESIYGIYVKH